MDKMDIINKIADEFSKLDYVDAVVLSGSQTGLIHDERSDYDMYVYSSKPVPLDFRRELAQKFTDTYEVGNTFFEDGDELNINPHPSFGHPLLGCSSYTALQPRTSARLSASARNPLPKAEGSFGVDLMYRNLDWVKGEVDWVWKNHGAKVGYTTCFLHNVKTSKILFDRNGEFKKYADELNQPFPEELKKNIIAKNYPLLREKSASYYEQIEFAISRNDLVSQNHRTTALLSSYFDILFALNGQTHPGEKKLIAYAEKLCPILPKDFKQDVENVVKSVGTDNILPAVDKLLDELDVIMFSK